MSLALDERQRAMLQEMHIRVWAPMAAPALAEAAAPEAAPAAAPARRVLPPAETAPAPAPLPPATPQPLAADGLQPLDLPALAQAVAACRACRLCEGRKAAVFAPAAAARQCDWMVVAEPPTDEDERAGQPCAGEAGELLDNMLRAVGCSREGLGAAGAWLTHVVKCRPGAAANPTAQELALCAAHLRREVALVQPRVILAMGRFAAQSLLAQTVPGVAQVPPGQLRGRLHAFEGVPVVVTNSPARLLRASADKAGSWVDLCLARAAAQRPPDPIASET